MVQVKDLLKAGYKFTQKLVFEYPFEEQKDFDNETLLSNPYSEMTDIVENGDGEDFISFIIEVHVPEEGNDHSYNINAYQREMIEILEMSDTIDDFRGYILNL